jgi:DNA (cytosine-5)-methyltransferase 1
MANAEPDFAPYDAPTFLSLFSGCGGLDLGFVNAGFRCLGAFDTDTGALAVHRANLRGKTFQHDLSSGKLPITPSRIDVVLSGSPCQGFSTIGKRRLDDLRNTLLIAAGRIAVQVRPRVFVAENVPGVQFGPHRKYWGALMDILRSAGYSCQTLQLNASDLGVAQMRKRLFLIAFANALNVTLRFSPIRPKTLRDIISDISSEKHPAPNHCPEQLEIGTEQFRIAQRIKQGQKLCNVRVSERAVHTWDIPEVFGRITEPERLVLKAVLRLRRRDRIRPSGDADPVLRSSIEKAVGFRSTEIVESLVVKNYLRQVGRRVDLRHTFNGKYRRASWDAQSFTVDTSFGNPKNFLHPELHRGFSVREAARIQGFPDHFIFSGASRDQFKFVGNAVPPPMAQALASEILRVVKS